MLVRTVGELRELIENLPDDVPVVGINDEVPLIFYHEYEDIPEEARPAPALVIEV